MADHTLLTAGQVTKLTGVTRKALRHYEAVGLLEPDERTEAGYRQYGENALRRLELIRRARLLGLSLADTAEFLRAAAACCDTHHPELATLLQSKLEEIERRLTELHELRRAVARTLERLGGHHGEHHCAEPLCTCRQPLTIERRRAG